MSFIKTRSILHAFIIIAAATITLAILPEVSLAGVLVEKCNRNFRIPLGQAESDENIARAAHNRLNCYADEMVSIKQHVRDIKTLNREVVKIRGSRNGDYKKHYCPDIRNQLEDKLSGFVNLLPSGANLNFLHDYFKSEGGYVTVNFPVRNGICSSYWNEEVAMRNEYFRLTCHVRIPVTDKEFVRPAFKAAIKNKLKYRSCFNRSISQELRDDFGIKNAIELKNVLNKNIEKWRKESMKSQYDELSESCKSLAVSIANRYVNYAKKNPLYCDQWSNVSK